MGRGVLPGKIKDTFAHAVQEVDWICMAKSPLGQPRNLRSPAPHHPVSHSLGFAIHMCFPGFDDHF